jgi:putative aldouronate transport system substrate-binding protein
MGLIDQDLMVEDDTTAKSKALQGSTGLAYTSMGQMSNWRREADEAGTGADWVGLQYPKGDDGTLSMVFGGYGIGAVVSSVSGDCPDDKLAVALRVLDYAYTQEGHLYWNYGTQGVSWDYGDDGEPAYLPLVTEDPNGINDAISKYGGSTWSGSCIQSTKLLYMKNTTASIEANNLWYYPNIDVAFSWKMPSGVTKTADEISEFDYLHSSIATFVSETCAKLVTGEMGADDFETYCAQLESMGLSTVLEIQQAAYDRFMAR